MIIDNLNNISKYAGLSKKMDIAFKHIGNGLDKAMENGTMEISGRDVFAVCAEYETKNISNGKNEAHRNYIDIQILLAGNEIIYASNIDDLEVIENYNSDKDVLFLEKSTRTAIDMKEGMFCIFFPWDAHMPGISGEDGPKKVKKVVYKIHV